MRPIRLTGRKEIPLPTIRDLIENPLPAIADLAPWAATIQAETLVAEGLKTLGVDYAFADGVAIHQTATVEPGAILKGPCIVGPGCFIAASAYLRGGVWLERDAIVGPACELKSTLMHAGSKTAHLNFVGDSVIGRRCNVEAGAMIANYRNERDDKRIVIAHDGERIDTGVDKFGAILSDGTRIGANAVIAPGAILLPGSVVRRLELVDQAG